MHLKAEMLDHAAYLAVFPFVNRNFYRRQAALAVEADDSDAAQTYANVVVTANGNENSDKIKALVAALSSDKVKQFMEETYGGAVVPLF